LKQVWKKKTESKKEADRLYSEHSPITFSVTCVQNIHRRFYY